MIDLMLMGLAVVFGYEVGNSIHWIGYVVSFFAGVLLLVNLGPELLPRRSRERTTRQ